MKTAGLLLASLLAALPAVAAAQGVDAPNTGSAPSSEAGGGALPDGSAPGAAPEDAQAAKPPKSGPYFGFSLGTGKTSFSGGGTTWDMDDHLGAVNEMPLTLHLQLRSGWGTGPFLLGLQFNMTQGSTDEGGLSRSADFMGFDFVGTWWDQEMGLYGRAGIGLAAYSATAGNYESDTFNGTELMLGFGVTMGGLGVGIDMFRQMYDETETGFDSVSFLLVSLSLDFY